MKLSEAEKEKHRAIFRKLSNSAKYTKAYKLAKSLTIKHPEVLLFAYYEALMTAEDDFSFSEKQTIANKKLAVKKFRKLLYRLRSAPEYLRKSIKNEYYWFSDQPYKQYKLGVSEVKSKQFRGGYYSQGVGAAMLARSYALKHKTQLAVRWAKRSESAWLKFFKINSKWYNSYLFYAKSLAYQGKLKESEKALLKAARIAKKSKNWKLIRKERADLLKVYSLLYSK